jgi:hypothetical protein
MFFAGEDSKSPGYGHLGCCHLLVISLVPDVFAERTSVKAGGKFQCSREIWSANPADSAEIRNLLSCSRSQDCDRNYQAAFSLIANHWRDHVDVKHGHADQSGDIEDSLGSWISADLLKRYEVLEKHDSEVPECFGHSPGLCRSVRGFSTATFGSSSLQ